MLIYSEKDKREKVGFECPLMLERIVLVMRAEYSSLLL